MNKPHGNAKLNSSAVEEIRRLKGLRSSREVARAFFIGRSTVLDIWAGRTWKTVHAS